jgi:hypothetical protein
MFYNQLECTVTQTQQLQYVILSEAKNLGSSFWIDPTQHKQRCFASLNMTELFYKFAQPI